MAVLMNKSKEILEKFKANGSFNELSSIESALVTTSINKEMKSVKRDYIKREGESVQSASKIILTS